MASIIKVIKGTTSVSLLNLSGFHLRDEGWGMNPAERETGIVRDRIRCSLIAANKDDAANQFLTLNNLIKDAVSYSKNEPIQNVPVYIETQHFNETNKRYALIAGDYVRFKRSPYHKVAQVDSSFEELDLVITREHPWRSHKPGILPGRILLTATDGPDYEPDETNFDVDLSAHDGQLPHTLVPWQLPFTATGGIIGRPGKFGRGVQVGEEMENLVEQTVFGIADITKWDKGGLNTIVRSTVQKKFGTHSLKCTYQNNITLAFTAMTLTADPYIYGLFVYIPSDYDGAGLRTNFAGYVGISLVYGIPDMGITDQWQFVFAEGTPDVGDVDGWLTIETTGAAPTAGKFIYIDGVDCYASTYPLPHCDGDLGPGHSWSGVAHDSTSDRVAHVLRYAIDDISSKGTIGFQIKQIYEEDEVPADKWAVALSDGTANNVMYFYINHTNNRYEARYYGNAAVVAIFASDSDVDRLVYADIVMTWDVAADEFKLFIDGSQISTTGTGLTAASAAWDRLYIGGRYDAALQWSGWIDDLFLLDRVMSPDEVSAHYDSGKPFVGDPNLFFHLPFDGPRTVHIANFRDDVELTHIYNKVGAAWGINLVAETEWELFSAGVATGDAVWFGSTDQPFKHIVLNLRTVGVFTTFDFEFQYWNGVAWIALVYGTDYTLFPHGTIESWLGQRGNIVFNVKPPSNWAKKVENAVDAYWIRLIETVMFPAYVTEPIHAGQVVYAPNTNELRIPSTSLHGDALPTVLLRMFSPGGGDENPGFSSLSRIIWGIKSRGLDHFVSSLNPGGQDNPGGWATAYGNDTAFAANPASPGGRCAVCSFAGDETLSYRVRFTGSDRLQYWLGSYRAFILAEQIGGADGDVSLMLRTRLVGVSAYDLHVDSELIDLTDTDVGMEVATMGTVNVPFAVIHSADLFTGAKIYFEIHASRATGSAATLAIYQLILIPRDEASSEINDPAFDTAGGSSALRSNELIDHDGGVIVRRTNKAHMDCARLIGASVDWDSGGAFVEFRNLDANARIYFLLSHYPFGGTWGTGPLIASSGCHLTAELHLHHRYRLLRGND